MAIPPQKILSQPDFTGQLMTTPTYEQTLSYFMQGDLVPVYSTLLADLETPVSVFMKLASHNMAPAFLLESVEGGEQVGRYSFIGVDPDVVISVRNGMVHRTEHGQDTACELPAGKDPLHIIEDEINRYRPVDVPGLPRLIGGAVGFMAYDLVRYFERLPDTAVDVLDVPDVAFMFPRSLVIFDHARRQIVLLANAHNQGDEQAAYNVAVERIHQLHAALNQPLVAPVIDPTTRPGQSFRSNMAQEHYEDNVRHVKQFIHDGDAFQVVLSQRFSLQTEADPFSLYRALRALNPSPYMFYLRFSEDLILVGASPEMMVRYEDGVATTRPIAGTRPRGDTVQQDDAYAEELLADEKERAEHVMLVDLGRNDLGRVCDYGTVKVTRMMQVERYSHVMHITSQVEGQLRPDMNAFDLIRATFPAGTLSGAPKVRAMEIIEQLEGERRGAYGGAVGYFSFDGSMDTCITIRSMLVKGDRVYVQAGAGLVADSVPTTEHIECGNKAMAQAKAVEYAERGLRNTL